jgi:protein subunit release factor A
VTDPRAWTQFDPSLLIDEYSNETAHLVVVTHLPTGIQASCGKYGAHIQNRAAAIAQLKLKVVGE